MTRRSVVAIAAACSVGALLLSGTAGAATRTTKKATTKTTTRTTARAATTVPATSAATTAPATTARPTTTAATATTVRGGKPVDPNGTLRIATTFTGAGGYEIDPSKGVLVTFDQLSYLLMGMPLVSRDGQIEPYLAESYSVPDSRTVRVVLRRGLTFQDGKPYDAKTVADAILGHRDRATPSNNPALLRQIDTITVDSPTQFTVKTSTPISTLIVNMLASSTAAVASPGSNPALPAGAGPYRAVEYKDRQFLRLERWDGFYRSKDFLVKNIELTNIPDIAAKQSALRSGQVDLISNAANDLDALVNSGPFAKVVTNNEGYYQFSLCSNHAPLFDTKLRKAVALAIDREQINKVVLGGNGVAMESILAPGSKYALKGVFKPEGDPDAARALLREIRWDGSKTFPIVTFPGFPIHQRIAEVVQGQLDRVGIKAELKIITPGQLPSSLVNERTGGGVILAQINPGIAKVSISLVDRATSWNPCDVSDAALTTQVQRLTDASSSEAEQREVWTALQQRVIDDTLIIPLVTQPCTYAYNKDKVQGLLPGTVGLTCATHPSMFLEGVSIIGK